VKKLSIAIFAIFAQCIGHTSFAEGNTGPLLIPANGIYGLPLKGSGDKIDVLPPHINSNFITAIGYDRGEPKESINWFHAELTRLFVDSVIEDLSTKVKSRTYAVSLQITRADQYSVDMDDGRTTVYLPVGVNIYFTNILTGEVLYSANKTGYANLVETKDNYHSGRSLNRILTAYRDELNQVITAVLVDAKNRFKPLQIEAEVAYQFKEYLILNKGMDAGISSGLELTKSSGEGVQVLYAGKSYSVGVLTLGEIRKKDIVSVYSTTSANDVKKPRVLILDADAPQDIPGNYASTQFTEELGDKASFTIVPINPDFSQVLVDISSRKGGEQAEITQSRVLPVYYIRLKIFTPIVYELKSNHDFGGQRVFEGSAFAELIDRSGRVIFATEVHEDIKDTIISHGMAFDIRDRNKVLYGNLLKTLSQKFIENVKFSRNEFVITKNSPDGVEVKDNAGVLAVNQNATVMHKVGEVSGITEAVSIPTWIASVVDRTKDQVKLHLDLPTIQHGLDVRAGADDYLLVEGNGKEVHSRSAFSLCDQSQDLGTMHLPELRDIAYFSIGKVFSQPFYGGEYPVSSRQKNLNDETSMFDRQGFKKRENSSVIKPQYCLSPLLKITESARNCSSDDVCEITLNIIVGMQVMLPDNTKGPKKILGVDYKIENIPSKSLEQIVRRKAMLKTIELMPDVIKGLDVSQL